jgi:fructose-1,6-bisphosphatase/inositol monophosphatase family enzyme
MHPTPDDFNDLEALLHNALRDAAPWVESNCGRVENETKPSVGVEATAINQAVTVVDRGLQDRVLAPVLARFPNVMPLVEEHTPLAERHRGNRGPWAFILDPIDGTLSYARGRHDYSTLAALSVGGRLVFGCVARYHPFEIRFARVADTAAPQTGDGPERLRVACHYRLFRSPFGAVERRLREAGCGLTAIPAESGDEGLGSNGPAILALCDGRFDAYLAPHVALHDIAGPWCVAAAAGCATVKFQTCDPAAPEDWAADPAGRFDVPDAASYPRRFRVMIARTREVSDRLLGILTARRQ